MLSVGFQLWQSLGDVFLKTEDLNYPEWPYLVSHWNGWTHDDVIKWKHFRVTGPLCGEFTGPGEFPAQRPVTRSFDVFFDLRLNKRLS